MVMWHLARGQENRANLGQGVPRLVWTRTDVSSLALPQQPSAPMDHVHAKKEEKYSYLSPLEALWACKSEKVSQACPGSREAHEEAATHVSISPGRC